MPLACLANLRRTALAGLLFGLLSGAFAGCATHKVDWQSRVGSATYDDSVREMGPPEKTATLTDGTIVADWLLYRGQTFADTDPAVFAYHYRRPYFGYAIWPTTTTVTRSPDQLIRLTFGPDKVLKEWKKVYR